MTPLLTRRKQVSLFLSGACTLLINFWANPSLAGDPFRLNNPRPIGSQTEAAFNALFQQGNYQQAKSYLLEANKTETNEPLAYAMRASLAYLNADWDGLKSYSTKTLENAQKLKVQDPLRGNIYLAVGNFLQGAYLYEKEGPMGAIGKLQEVFKYFDEASKLDANDPELNLLKGYMDLLLAVNLPFSTPEQAIEKLETYASPDYLVNRGIAIAYRDLKQYEKALEFVNLALTKTPENPEVFYLKGQILRQKGKKNKDQDSLKQAITYFEKALAKSEQLPTSVLKTLKDEHQKTQKKLAEYQATNR